MYEVWKFSTDKNYKDKAVRHWKEFLEKKISPTIQIDDTDKLKILSIMYSGLYSELRSKDTMLQNVTHWGIAVLGTSGIAIKLFENRITPHILSDQEMISTLAVVIILFTVTFALTGTISWLSKDRMSVARQLDRIQQICGAYVPGQFCEETTLFNPNFYGWGFDPERDVNHSHAKRHPVLLWTIAVGDIFLISAPLHASGFFGTFG